MIDKPKPLIEHLEDLRKLLIKSLALIAVFTVAGFIFSPKLLDMYIKSVGMSIYYFNPLGAFYTRIKLSIWLGLIAASPFILYFIWDYIRITLNPKEYRLFTTAYTLSTAMFLAGFILSALFIAPKGLKLLTTYGNPSKMLVPMIEVNSMLSFVFYISLGTGIIMIIPAIEYTLCETGVIKKDFLKKQRKLVFTILLVFSAIITPTVDILTMTLVAITGYILFELTLLFLK